MLYFQINGKIKEYNGHDVFDWQHAYSIVYPPKDQYTPEGEFMSFRHYNVEVRERVKCINYEGKVFGAVVFLGGGATKWGILIMHKCGCQGSNRS